MTSKSFILSSIAGTITYFLLGWLFYGMLFTEIYPNEGSTDSVIFIFFGCVFYAILFSYILSRLGNINTFRKGINTGLLLGFLYTLSMNFFMYSSQTLIINNFFIDILVGTLSTGIMSGFIGYVFGKTK